MVHAISLDRDSCTSLCFLYSSVNKYDVSITLLHRDKTTLLIYSSYANRETASRDRERARGREREGGIHTKKGII